MRTALIALLTLGIAGCATGNYRDSSVPITTVPQVDLNRYAGLWYEIARFPVSFEEGCVGVTAEYALNDDGSVKVVNSCREGSLSAEPRTATARATVQDETNAKLSVDFVPYIPFTSGDYWILDLDKDYQTVVVGTPSGFAGWILARQPQISEARLQRGYDVLRRNGYDLSQITLTPQEAAQ